MRSLAPKCVMTFWMYWRVQWTFQIECDKKTPNSNINLHAKSDSTIENIRKFRLLGKNVATSIHQQISFLFAAFIPPLSFCWSIYTINASMFVPTTMTCDMSLYWYAVCVCICSVRNKIWLMCCSLLSDPHTIKSFLKSQLVSFYVFFVYLF